MYNVTCNKTLNVSWLPPNLKILFNLHTQQIFYGINHKDDRMQENVLLNLSDKSLRNKDVDIILTALAKDSSINQLDLSNNLLGDQGIKKIVKSTFIKKVFYFTLYNNRIGDEGALALILSSRTNNIASLNLSKNRITAEGIKSIAKHLPGSKIVNLDIIFNPGSDHPSAYNALEEAAKTHRVLQYMRVPSEFNSQIKPILLENREYVSLTKKKLIRLITDLKEQDEFEYPLRELDTEILIKFQEFYYNQMLNSSLIVLNCDQTCKRIQNYINDHYFKITGVVCDGFELEHFNGTSIADLPQEVLREITKHCTITDVVVEPREL